MNISLRGTSIIPKLFLSDRLSSEDINFLKQYNIKALLTIKEVPKEKKIIDMYNSLGIKLLFLPLYDNESENIYQYFDKSFSFIEENISNNNNVLVHCEMGISRSATLVIHYILKKLYMSNNTFQDHISVLNAAINIVKSKRPIINPNNGFIKQLLEKSKQYFNLKNKHNNKMSETNEFKDSNGNPANIIQLTNNDFTDIGDLKYFQDVNGLLFFYENWCGHCNRTKPEFIDFATMLKGTNIRAFMIEGSKNQDLISRVNPMTWGYEIRGYPTIVSYNKGKFFSNYSPDFNNISSYRKKDDFFAYAKDIGNINIVKIVD